MINKNSTWRSDTYVLNPGLNEIYFSDTYPNAFYIVNNNNTYLYVGLKNIPTNSRYERKIRPNECDCFGRPLPLNRIYIINPTELKLNVEISSVHENFTLELLKSINASMDDEQINRIRFDGIINGWNTDDTVLTSVINLNDLKEPLCDKLEDLKHLQDSGNQTNILTNTKIQELSTKLDNLASKLDDIICYYNDSVTKLDAIIKASIKVTHFDTLDLNTSSTVYLNDLILISNDTITDIYINYDNKYLILKPGESISDIYNINDNINLSTPTGFIPADNNILPVRLIYTTVKEAD